MNVASAVFCWVLFGCYYLLQEQCATDIAYDRAAFSSPSNQSVSTEKVPTLFCFVTVFSSVLFKQHFVAILLLMRQIGAFLLIEKSAFAWYYVDTARETNKNKQEEIKMKNSIKTRKTSKIKRTVASMLAAVMMMTTAATISASANTQAAITMNTTSAATQIARDQYMGHDIIEGAYHRGTESYRFKFSDGFFETDAKEYNTHMATTSMAMTHASVTVKGNGDYSHGADSIKEILEKEGFGDIFVTDTYTQKPDTDTVACAIANKTVDTKNGKKQVVSVTVRSANYEKEWASNVTLGKGTSEAKGFAEAAGKVIKHIEKYLKEHSLNDGNVVFWVQGYSRGAATANIAAKRLIDNYSKSTVYAYCLGCPQGGAACEEKKGADYSGIHNVINVDDITTYVAPSGWGFKRYGVDHYLNDESFDSSKLQKNRIFPNNVADNNADTDISKERLALVEKYISKIACSDKDKNDSMPFTLGDKKVARHGLKDLKLIDDPYLKMRTRNRLAEFMNSLTNGISRDEYVGSGVEDALRRLMIYTNSGENMLKTFDSFDLKALKSYMGFKFITTILCNTSVSTVTNDGWFKTILKVVTNNDKVNYHIDFNDSVKKALADVVEKYLREDKNANKAISTYPNGVDQAVKDIRAIINTVLKGVNNIDSVATIGAGAAKLTHNHSFIQSLAWVASYDSWFNDLASDKNADIEVLDIEDVDLTFNPIATAARAKAA